MQETDQRDYVRLCILYRTITALLCTFLYLLPILDGDRPILLKLWVGGGMLLACLLSNLLYLYAFRQDEHEHWFRILLTLELFAYGIFVFLSGGLSSPYLWYYIACLFIMLAFKQRLVFSMLGIAWCVLCVIANRLILSNGRALDHQELNLAMGAAIIFGTIYVLLYYLDQLRTTQEQQHILNTQIKTEKERSEQALLHITDLYDALNLFALTDPRRVIHALGMTLFRTIAPEGCILIKKDSEGAIERQEICGIDEAEATYVLACAEMLWQAPSAGVDSSWRDIDCSSLESVFEGVPIKMYARVQGIFIRKKVGFATWKPEEDQFYRGIIEIIFRNLDTQKQVEAYIAMEEKTRLASEIHDTAIQKLFGLVCGLKLLEVRENTLTSEERVRQLGTLKRSAELTMTELREAIYGRLFDGCDEEGFAERLRCSLGDLEDVTGAKINLRLDGEVKEMTASQKIALYRICCESANNAIRHGKAQNLDVHIEVDKDYIRMEVIDDGTGMRTAPTAPLSGKGLKNMERMVALLNGQIVFQSRKNKGTKIKLCLPR